jgi:uncharacterized protein YutE (UPF0331/DUF86 family)
MKNDTVLLAKLTSLQRCLKRIKSKAPESVEELTRDLDLQDIIVLNLQRAVQVSVDLASHIVAELDLPSPSTMSDSFARLDQAGVIPSKVSERMQKSVGLRNIAVHEYTSLSWVIIHDVCAHHLDDFRDFAKAILAWLDSHNTQTDR